MDYVKNEMAPKANTVKVSQEVKAASAVQTKQENSQEYHSEGNKEYLKSSGIVAQEKIPVIPEEHKGVAIESYSKSVSDGQHIHKTAEYYQSVEDYVKTER